MMNNVYGHSGFYWFMGVVEDRNDPLKMGRCRVRVAAYHTSDKTVLPTEDLPWAMPLLPITSAATSGVGVAPVGPVEGTWIFGFFLDGEDGQMPIMLGTFPARVEPVNLTQLVKELATALTSTLTLSDTGLSSNAVPTMNAVQAHADRVANQMAADVAPTDTTTRLE